MIFGRKVNTEVRSWIVGGRVEPEPTRPFLLDGEKVLEGGEAVDSRAMGTIGAGRVFPTEATVALLENPNLPL